MAPRGKGEAAAGRSRAVAGLSEREIETLRAAAAIFQDLGLVDAGDVAEAASSPATVGRRKAAATVRRGRLPAGNLPDREAQILTVAAEVFREKGFAATSIQDIADRVGILKGSLYYYIDSKDDLLYRIGGKVHAELMREQEAAAAPDAPPLVRVRTFIRTHVIHSTDHLAEAAAFFGEFRAFAGERRAEIVGWRDEYEAAFRALVGACQADGSISSEIDVHLVSLGAFGMMNSVHLWYRPDGRRSPRQIADALADLVIEGLAARAG